MGIIRPERTERSLWIKPALQDPNAEPCSGWDNKKKRLVQDRRVAIVVQNYVVIHVRKNPIHLEAASSEERIARTKTFLYDSQSIEPTPGVNMPAISPHIEPEIEFIGPKPSVNLERVQTHPFSHSGHTRK